MSSQFAPSHKWKHVSVLWQSLCTAGAEVTAARLLLSWLLLQWLLLLWLLLPWIMLPFGCSRGCSRGCCFCSGCSHGCTTYGTAMDCCSRGGFHGCYFLGCCSCCCRCSCRCSYGFRCRGCSFCSCCSHGRCSSLVCRSRGSFFRSFRHRGSCTLSNGNYIIVKFLFCLSNGNDVSDKKNSVSVKVTM